MQNKSIIQIRLKKENHIKIKYISEIEHRSLNAQMEYSIEQYIKAFEQENGEILIPRKSE